MNDKMKEYIKAWLNKADSDLKNAELVLGAEDENLPYDTVCFHCQQAVEKYLKAYCTYHDISFPYTHNLADLAAKLQKKDKNIESIRRDVETLTPYAVEIRYPDDTYLPSREDAQDAYEIAVRIKKIVTTKINFDLAD